MRLPTTHTTTHTMNAFYISRLLAALRSAKHVLGWKIRLAAIAAAVLLPPAGVARADSMSYSIDISSSLQLIEAPNSSSAQSQVSQQSGLVDRVANNNPFVEITNTSTTADITNIQLTLNDPESVIEALKVLSSDGTPTGAFATNVYGGPATSIDISLGTPLAPGQSVLWTMELAPVNGYSNTGWTPGYQNILFPGSNPIPGTNASIAVTYLDPSTSNTTNSPSVLPDLDTFDDDMTVDPATTCCSTGTPTSLYSLDVPSGSVTPTSTPEPESIMLMVLGGVPLAVHVWRKRKRAATAAAFVAVGA